MHLRAVDRDHLHVHQARLGAQLQHVAEQLTQRPLMALAKPRDRRVIRRLVGRDHPHRDILMAAPLDPPRGPLADRVRVDQQRHHHRRVVRRATPAVVAIAGQERRQIHRLDSVQDKPREVILRQPLPQTRRQQQLLLAITRDEVLRHPDMVLTPPDGALCNSHDARAGARSRVLLADEISRRPELNRGAARYPARRGASVRDDDRTATLRQRCASSSCRRRLNTHPRAPVENAPPGRWARGVRAGMEPRLLGVRAGQGEVIGRGGAVGGDPADAFRLLACRSRRSRGGRAGIATRCGGRCGRREPPSYARRRRCRSSIRLGTRFTGCWARIRSCRGSGCGS